MKINSSRSKLPPTNLVCTYIPSFIIPLFGFIVTCKKKYLPIYILQPLTDKKIESVDSSVTLNPVFYLAQCTPQLCCVGSGLMTLYCLQFRPSASIHEASSRLHQIVVFTLVVPPLLCISPLPRVKPCKPNLTGEQ